MTNEEERDELYTTYLTARRGGCTAPPAGVGNALAAAIGDDERRDGIATATRTARIMSRADLVARVALELGDDLDEAVVISGSTGTLTDEQLARVLASAGDARLDASGTGALSTVEFLRRLRPLVTDGDEDDVVAMIDDFIATLEAL